MMIFLIKSTICQFVLYGFYHFFLRHQKIFLFNRFYMIFSMIFSMIIPLIDIPVKSDFTFNNSFDKFSQITENIFKGEAIIGNSSSFLTFQNILTALFLIISAILLVRFTLNIFRILRKIIKNKKVDYPKLSLVLVEEKTLPYSFFKYVFVNRSEFENNKIEIQLLMHEEVHCLQYHSIDIIIIELLNIFLWFNPAIWLLRREILLNHEYYADNQVLTNSDFNEYHRLILNGIIQNNFNYLVSNFKDSLIKNRLIMMTLSGPSANATLRKIASISLFLLLGIVISCSQQTNSTDETSSNLQGSQVIDKMPQFPGGEYALRPYIMKNTYYPKEAKKEKIQGTVIVDFNINAEGKATNVKVNKPIHPLLDNEAIRVIKSMSAWEPGSGNLADAGMHITITFQLRE